MILREFQWVFMAKLSKTQNFSPDHKQNFEIYQNQSKP